MMAGTTSMLQTLKTQRHAREQTQVSLQEAFDVIQNLRQGRLFIQFHICSTRGWTNA